MPCMLFQIVSTHLFLRHSLALEPHVHMGALINQQVIAVNSDETCFVCVSHCLLCSHVSILKT